MMRNITRLTKNFKTHRLAFFDYVMASKPLHYWSMNELTGNTAYDFGSGNVNGSVGSNVVKGVFSKVGTGMEFDGSGHHVNCSNAASSSFTALTISCLYKASTFAPNRWRTELHRNDGTSVGSSVFFIGHETGTNNIIGTIGAGFGAPGTYLAGDTNFTAIVDTWYYIVAVWNGTIVNVYINGSIRKTYSYAGSLTNKPATTRIGTSGNYHFNGTIDEVGIWDTALSDGEIKKLTKLAGV